MRCSLALVTLFLIVIPPCLGAETEGETPQTGRLAWPSAPPRDCPFEPSKALSGILFTGVHSSSARTARRFGSATRPTGARWNGMSLKINPPGGRYGLCLHEVRLWTPGDEPEEVRKAGR